MTGFVRFYNIVTTDAENGIVEEPLDTAINQIDGNLVQAVEIVNTSKLDNGNMKYTVAVYLGLNSNPTETARFSSKRETFSLLDNTPVTVGINGTNSVFSTKLFVLVSKNFKEAIYDVIDFDYNANTIIT